MIRRQIQLTEEQAETLRRTAQQRGVSSAEIIREALDRHLAMPVGDVRRRRAVSAIGGFHSGRRDVSTRHDDHLADAFAQ